MTTVRVRATADADGELRISGLPVRKGDSADVIVVIDGQDADLLMAILESDSAWAWLREPAEDVYTEQDAR